MKKPTVTRRYHAALPWVRAAVFAAASWLALATLGFYPPFVGPVAALTVGALGLVAPGVGVLVFLVAAGIPLLAGDIIAGAVFLALGFSAIQYLSDDHGRAFVVIALSFAATVLHAQWAIVVLAGFLFGASEGAILAFITCLVIQGAGLLLGLEAVAEVPVGGVRPALVSLEALRSIDAPLAFGWLPGSLARLDVARAIGSVTGMSAPILFSIQPFVWAVGAAVAGLLRRPVGDPRRATMSFVAAAAGTATLAVCSAGVGLALGGPVPLSDYAIATAAALAVALAGVAASEYLFTPSMTEPAPTAADDADVDELLRMIATAEEELTAKHTMSRTVLITDMKSFSRLTQELGSTETAKLVQRHRDLLLPIIGAHGGKGKSTGGDGLLAAFETPAEALAAAAEMQQTLADYNARRSGEEAVLIRAGIAIGEVVLDKGGKPFLGDALNLAARVMALADGGQVFTSRTVLERGGGTAAFGAVSHGTFNLKNIAVPVEVVEILWRQDQEARPPHPEDED